MQPNPKNVSGSAIVAVLLVVAIITIIAVGLMSQQRIDIRRTQQLQTASQAYRYSQAVVFWAAGELKKPDNASASDKDQDTVWQLDFPSLAIEGNRGQVNGRLERLDQRVNLNGLTEITDQDDFVLSMGLKVPDLSEFELRSILKNLNDWVAPTNDTTEEPANNDSYYTSLTPPYSPAHMPMVSVSELRLVVGVEAEVYQKLLPYIIALPSEVVGKTGKDYYLLQAEVVLDDQRLRVYSILHKQGAPPSVVVKVLWSTRGTW